MQTTQQDCQVQRSQSHPQRHHRNGQETIQSILINSIFNYQFSFYINITIIQFNYLVNIIILIFILVYKESNQNFI
jgi:hypothetical protein